MNIWHTEKGGGLFCNRRECPPGSKEHKFVIGMWSELPSGRCHQTWMWLIGLAPATSTGLRSLGKINLNTCVQSETKVNVVPGHGDLDIDIVGFMRVKVLSVRTILF